MIVRTYGPTHSFLHSPRNVIRTKLSPPLFTSLPHHPRPLHIKLSRPQKPQQVLVGESIISGSRSDPFVRRVGWDQVLGFENSTELGERLLLCLVAVGGSGIQRRASGLIERLTGDQGDPQGDL